MLQQIANIDLDQDASDFTVASKSASSRSPKTPERRRAYNRKFADLLFLLRVSTEEVIVVHQPQVLGDNYEELVESLSRLGDAGKKLVIVPRNQRDHGYAS